MMFGCVFFPLGKEVKEGKDGKVAAGMNLSFEIWERLTSNNQGGKMKMKKLMLAALVLTLLFFSGAALIGATEYPSAKDYEKDVPPAILKRASSNFKL